jgi:hypothetical protein
MHIFRNISFFSFLLISIVSPAQQLKSNCIEIKEGYYCIINKATYQISPVEFSVLKEGFFFDSTPHFSDNPNWDSVYSKGNPILLSYYRSRHPHQPGKGGIYSEYVHKKPFSEFQLSDSTYISIWKVIIVFHREQISIREYEKSESTYQSALFITLTKQPKDKKIEVWLPELIVAE